MTASTRGLTAARMSPSAGSARWTHLDAGFVGHATRDIDLRPLPDEQDQLSCVSVVGRWLAHRAQVSSYRSPVAPCGVAADAARGGIENPPSSPAPLPNEVLDSAAAAASRSARSQVTVSVPCIPAWR